MTRGMNSGNRMVADLHACPDLTGRSRLELADIGLKDALRLAGDVRDVDPRVVWGRLTRWSKTDPDRLVMATVALAALVDPEAKVQAALAWTEKFEMEEAA